jgi:hypothetical protein
MALIVPSPTSALKTFAQFWCVTIFGVQLLAHDVVWPENPSGFNPSAAMVLNPGESKVIRVQPITGELCTVSTTILAPTSGLVAFKVLTSNPAREVDILVTPLRAPNNGDETIQLGGHWEATGLDEDGTPDPECNAVFPNPFTVPVRVTTNKTDFFISSVSSWSVRPGDPVVFGGMGFSQVSRVSFGGMDAQFITTSDTLLRAVAPTDAPVGPITFFTPAAQISTSWEFVVQPQVRLQQAADGQLMVAWGQQSYPFTLQSTTALGREPWVDLLTTFDNHIAVAPESGTFYRLLWNMIPLDRTDYNRERPMVASFYHQDPVVYWAQFGVPALSRLAQMRSDLKLEASSTFDGFMRAFQPDRFLAALETTRLEPRFAQEATNFLATADPTNAYIKTFMKLVRLDDASTNCGNSLTLHTNCYSTNTSIFVNAITNSMDITRWTNSAPSTNKIFFHPVQYTNSPPINWIDVHGSDAFTGTNTILITPRNDDNNTNFVTKWTDITASSIWKTTHDGACATVAVGASLAKLGAAPNEITCQFWESLSKQLGATPGTVGAFQTDIAALYKDFGYGCTEAYDGPNESAAQEAKKALDRGCDVQISYVSADKRKAHTEMVLDIAIDSADSSNATISTLSWGGNATVTYKGSIFGGSYSGKSDGQSYRASGETQSYLEGTGTATLRYYCKE